ncbi:MAG: hypothetical protein Q8O67_12245 [Deltaproteobacteria bacterium]|nr:hypothetical protein [Deltaproteobacteria bacterium]
MTALHLVGLNGPASLMLGSSSSRAAALLGDRPTLTLSADENTPDSCCTVRLVRHQSVWLGIIDDNAVFADRVRMGMVPRFVKGDADVVAVAGVARTRLLGRVSAVSAEIAGLVASLVGPWGAQDAIVIEISPESLVVVEDENTPGSVPRT